MCTRSVAPCGGELELASALSGGARREVDLVRLDHADPLLGREMTELPGGIASFDAYAPAIAKLIAAQSV